MATKAVNALSERVEQMPRSLGGAIAAFTSLNSSKVDGKVDRGALSVDLGGSVNMSSPLRANPQMWTDLMIVFEAFSEVLAKSHKKQTEIAIAQSLLSTDETMQTIKQAVEATNATLGNALAASEIRIRGDEELYSNILRRLRTDLRIDRERFGRLRDGMR